MKSLIHRINESKGTEFIDPKTTSIAADFDMLNKKMFDDLLIHIPFKWINLKDRVGEVAYDKETVGKRVVGEIPKSLGITKKWKLTRQQYLDVLAHEMIHLYFMQSGQFGVEHGKKFTGFVDKLNKANPEYNIKVTENPDEFSLNAKSKELGAILFIHERNNGKIEHSMIVVNPKSINTEEMEGFLTMLNKNKDAIFYDDKNLDVVFYKLSHVDLQKFKVVRSLKSKSLSLFNVDSKSDIINHLTQNKPVLSRKIK